MAKKANKIVIGSRGSDLALWQANFIKSELIKLGLDPEIKIIKTQGDKIQNLSFDKLEGKGFFTKELEDALLSKEIDMAVHSCKDVPTENPKGLEIVAFSEREDPSDLLLILPEHADNKQKFHLKKGLKVGTSSSRRKAQLLQFRPDIKIEDLRGNVPTRIDKLRQKKYDAIMLAAAGVERLEIDLSEFHVVKLSPREFVPAPAQGVLALQTRSTDKKLKEVLANLNSDLVSKRVTIERKVLNKLEGGCQMPLGVYCETDTDEDDNLYYKIWVALADAWDKPVKQLYFETSKADKIADKIVSKLKGIKPASVFITQNKKPGDYFGQSLRNLGYTVYSQSLIEFRLIPFKALPPHEWIFFSSKHAVKYFFIQKPQISKEIKFGVIGKGTGDELRRFGYRADFIGHSTNIQSTARQYAAIAGTKKTLFPHAKGSLKSIQQLMPKKDNILNLVVYETLKFEDVEIPSTDIVVFTSPSNVEAYFQKASFNPEKQKAVAMGDSTAHELTKHGIKPHAKPASFDELGLYQAVLSL